MWREGVGQDHVCGEREEGKIMCVERGSRPRSCVWREGVGQDHVCGERE